MWLDYSNRVKEIRNTFYDNNEYNSGPVSVLFDISSICYGLGCITCKDHSAFLPAHIRQRPTLPYYPIEEIVDIAYQLKAMGTDKIELCGSGEPLTHPKIKELALLLRELGFYLVLRTAGRPLYEIENPREILSLFNQVNLSLWAGTNKTYKQLHPLAPEGFFSFICKLFAEYHSRPTLKIINVLCQNNCHEISDMLSVASSLHATEVSFVNAYEPHWSNSIKLTGKKLGKATKVLQTIKRSNQEFIVNTSGFVNESYILPTSCIIPFIFARVDIHGEVYPCCGCWDYSIGNLRENSDFSLIWFSSKAKSFRKSCKRLPNIGYTSCHCKECVHSEDIQRYSLED